MSDFSSELQLTAELNPVEALDSFRKNIPEEWIQEAVTQTGRAAVRKRRFPAEQAVWLVLGIGLMRNRSITDVCDKLELAFPDSKGKLPPLATSSIVNARKRIGSEPLRYLFNTTATAWEKEDDSKPVCGLKVYSVDGTEFKTPDTEDNRKLGYKNRSATLPSVLAVTLMSNRTRLVSDVAFGPVSNSEISYAQELVGSAPKNSLTLFDRGFYSAELMQSWQGSGENTHWLMPIKKNLGYEVIEEFSEYDKIIEMSASHQCREKYPYLKEKWQARLVLIPEPKGEIKGFITSMQCPVTYPLKDIAKVYWERWGIEESYGELKQRQMDNISVLRSLKQEGIYQELWGVFISYNLVRLEMKRMAEEHDVEPLRISFINALRLIQDEFLWCSGRTPGTVPKKLKNLRESGKRLILPEKRKRKPMPRKILYKANKYAYRKRGENA